MRPQNKTPKKVEIIWTDIQEFSGWNSSQEIYSTKRVVSIGWLIQKSRHTVIITSCIDSTSIDEAYGSVLVIPTGVIISLKFLK